MGFNEDVDTHPPFYPCLYFILLDLKREQKLERSQPVAGTAEHRHQAPGCIPAASARSSLQAEKVTCPLQLRTVNPAGLLRDWHLPFCLLRKMNSRAALQNNGVRLAGRPACISVHAHGHHSRTQTFTQSTNATTLFNHQLFRRHAPFVFQKVRVSLIRAACRS